MVSDNDWSSFGELLGARVVRSRALSLTATALDLSDGRSVVVKAVPRQSIDSWAPGRPWTELVALDALAHVGAPVPKLLAADVHHGWLAMEYIDGHDLWQLSNPDAHFCDLASSLRRLEQSMTQEWDYLRDYAHHHPPDINSLLTAVQAMIPDGAKSAWDRLVNKARLGDHGDNSVTVGPLDVNARNVLWCNASASFVFIDMAVIGYDYTERRLVAYAQALSPGVTSMLSEAMFDWYHATYGALAAYRLACFDFIFWAIALARLRAALSRPDDTRLRQAVKTWGKPEQTIRHVMAMWRRPRIRDDDVDAIRHCLPGGG